MQPSRRSSGYVKAGTKLTLVNTFNAYSSGKWKVNGEWYGGLTRSITITINKDTQVIFYEVIN